MVSKAQHPISLNTPFYAAQGASGVLLHRYLDAQFLPKFLDDLGRSDKASLQATQGWRSEDQFSQHDKLPLLRLPVHRTFYLLSCEVSCDSPGLPALDRKKIESAGFVIRRGKPGVKEQAWKLRAGLAQGWQTLSNPGEGVEPDQYRYLLKQGLIQARSPEPPYSGEEVYPLHAMTVKHEGRSRTVLYGYVPLGGALNLPMETTLEKTETEETPDIKELEKELFWPFGTAQYSTTTLDSNGLPKTVGKSSVSAWRQPTGLQVNSGKPTLALLELIKVLINRYRIGDSKGRENEALETLLDAIHFLATKPVLDNAKSGAVDLSEITQQESLLEYLKKRRAVLIGWMTTAEPTSSKTPVDLLDKQLPYAASWHLYIQPQQAEVLRVLLSERLGKALQQTVSDLPIPRYQQGEEDTYFARVFVRQDDPCGCETITWGPTSELFRVAAPFDPEASRPHLIQLPDLSDLKRGAAKGVAFLTPKKLAEQIEAISPDMEIGPKPGSGKFGLDWIYSFSIPVVTLCAMILLMIIVSLLNIFLQWIPWVIVRIPIIKGFKKGLP